MMRLQEMIEDVRRLRSALREEREKMPDLKAAVEAAHAECVPVTGPFLLGEFGHLRDTDRPAYERERLRAVAADTKRVTRLREIDAAVERLAMLEAQYTAAAVSLADVI